MPGNDFFITVILPAVFYRSNTLYLLFLFFQTSSITFPIATPTNRAKTELFDKNETLNNHILSYLPETVDLSSTNSTLLYYKINKMPPRKSIQNPLLSHDDSASYMRIFSQNPLFYLLCSHTFDHF